MAPFETLLIQAQMLELIQLAAFQAARHRAFHDLMAGFPANPQQFAPGLHVGARQQHLHGKPFKVQGEPDNVHVPLSVLLPIPYDYVQYDTVPKAVVQATCEMARELLITDRTAAPAGEGLKYYNAGGVQTGYDKTDRRPVLSQVAQVMLAKYGSQISAHSGAVRLQRV
jgi:hypothetical protein